MPTENRSSNTDPRDVFIRLNPLGLGEAELRKDSTGFEDPRTHSDYLLFLAGYRETHAEPQPHPEPIAWMVGTAFWWTREEAERDAVAMGLPIVGLGPMNASIPAEQSQAIPVGEVVAFGKGLHEIAWAAGRMPKLGAKLYTHADPGEDERLRYKAELYDEVWELATGLGHMNVTTAISKLRSQLAECEAMAAMVVEREWAEHVGTGDVSSKVEAAFTQLHNDLHEASEKLAERDALLRELADAPPAAMEFRLQQKVKVALSASAEPSTPVEIDERAEFEAFFTEKAKTLPLLHGATTLRYPGGQYVGDWALFGFTVWQPRADLHCKP